MTMSMPALTPVADLGGVVAGDLVDALPVGDDEAVEAELALEHVGDELAVGVHLQRVAEPSSVQSTLENDGMTLPTSWRRTAAMYGDRSIRAKSRRLVTVMPWSMV